MSHFSVTSGLGLKFPDLPDALESKVSIQTSENEIEEGNYYLQSNRVAWSCKPTIAMFHQSSVCIHIFNRNANRLGHNTVLYRTIY